MSGVRKIATISNLYSGAWVVQVFLLSRKDPTMRRREEKNLRLGDETRRVKMYKVFEARHANKTHLFSDI